MSCFDLGVQENSPPSPPGFPSSSRSVARRVYAELQLVEQLYLLVDHERANDLTECLHFPSLSSSSITSASTCLLAAPSSSKADHLHPTDLPSLQHPVHLSDHLDIQPSPTQENLLGFLPSVTLPAPPPPAALLAALGGSPNSRGDLGREKSGGCGDAEEGNEEGGEVSQSRSHSKDRSERDEGEDEDEEMDETAREGGREEVFIVAKQKWKRRKRKRGKGGGSGVSKNKDEDASEESQSNASPNQPGHQQQCQDRSITGDNNEKEGSDEPSYIAVDERIKMEPSASSPTTCHQVSASPSHVGSRRDGVSPSTHRVSPTGGSRKPLGKSPSPLRAEGHSPKQNSNSRKSSCAAQVKREPSDVSNTSGGSQNHKSQLAKQKQKNSSAMSWLPAAFVDRKLTAAPLPSFTGTKK